MASFSLFQSSTFFSLICPFKPKPTRHFTDDSSRLARTQGLFRGANFLCDPRSVKRCRKKKAQQGLTAIMVPKELITQRMQASAKGRSWQVLDMVKTQLMMQVRGEGVSKVAAVMYDGVSATMKQILKEEGWIGLTRGMGPRVLLSACFSALGYFAFETMRLSILHEYLRRKEKKLSEAEVSVTTTG